MGQSQREGRVRVHEDVLPVHEPAGAAYPAMLVTTSLNDSQVLFHEPAKYVAKLRTLKTDSHPLLFKCNMDAGHGGASGRYDSLKEEAFVMAFVLEQMGLGTGRSEPIVARSASEGDSHSTRTTLACATGYYFQFAIFSR